MASTFYSPILIKVIQKYSMSIDLHNVDCIDFMKSMKDNSVNMTLTDIPYDVVNNYECGIREYNKGKAD